jgi:hypothetical protein
MDKEPLESVEYLRYYAKGHRTARVRGKMYRAADEIERLRSELGAYRILIQNVVDDYCEGKEVAAELLENAIRARGDKEGV